MQTEERRLTFDVGGDRPIGASYRVSGKLFVDVELRKGDDDVVTIANADGEIVAAGHGFVNSIGFKEHRPGNAPPWTERIHGVKLQ